MLTGMVKSSINYPTSSRGLGHQRKNIYLHVGCGLVAPDKWVNVDASWNARLAKRPWLRTVLAKARIISLEAANVPWPRNIRVWDVTRGLPYLDSTVSAIYASHFLEHLHYRSAAAFLREGYRVLGRGGTIRVVVPDLKAIAYEYIKKKSESEPGDPWPPQEFLYSLGVFRREKGVGTPWLHRLYRAVKPYDLHQWLYDEASLRALLSETGFTEIGRKRYLESQIPYIAEVEQEERLEGAVCLEALKP